MHIKHRREREKEREREREERDREKKVKKTITEQIDKCYKVLLISIVSY